MIQIDITALKEKVDTMFLGDSLTLRRLKKTPTNVVWVVQGYEFLHSSPIGYVTPISNTVSSESDATNHSAMEDQIEIEIVDLPQNIVEGSIEFENFEEYQIEVESVDEGHEYNESDAEESDLEDVVYIDDDDEF